MQRPSHLTRAWLAAAVAACALAACGGGGGGETAPAGSPAPPPAPAAAPASHAFALDSDAGLVRVLSADAATGALTQVPGSTYAVGGRPVALAVLPDKGLLAVVSANAATSGTLRLFRIAAAGDALAPVGASVAVGVQPTAVTGTADGSFLYVTDAQGVEGFAVNATGAVQRLPGSPFATGYAEIGTTLDPVRHLPVALPEAEVRDHPAADLQRLGSTLFLATNKDSQGDISTLGIRRDGTLFGLHTGAAQCAVGLPAMGSTFSPSGAGTIAVGFAGHFVYGLNRDSSSIAGYRPSGGDCLGLGGWMAPVQGSPFATGPRPGALAADPLGAYLYAAHTGGAGQVSAYMVQPDSGKLTPVRGSPFPLAMVPARMWMDSQGKYLYTSDAAGNLDVLTIDRATGAPGAARSTLLGLRAHVVANSR